MLGLSSRHLLQSKSFLTVHNWQQVHLQDVSRCTSGTTSTLQTQTPQKKVKISRFSPGKELSKFLLAFVKSLLFAGGYTALVRRTVCFVSQNFKFVGCNIISYLRFQPDSCHRGQCHSYLLTGKQTIINSIILLEQNHGSVLQHGQKKRMASQTASRRVPYHGSRFEYDLLPLHVTPLSHPRKL